MLTEEVDGWEREASLTHTALHNLKDLGTVERKHHLYIHRDETRSLLCLLYCIGTILKFEVLMGLLLEIFVVFIFVIKKSPFFIQHKVCGFFKH